MSNGNSSKRGHGHVAKPGSHSSSPGDVFSLTFNQRLDYLRGAGTTPTTPTITPFNPSKSPPSQSKAPTGKRLRYQLPKPSTSKDTITEDTTSASSMSAFGNDKKRPKSWRRYRPAFQPGDFMCPQCGSHNFRPPEWDYAAMADSKVLIRQKQTTPRSTTILPSFFEDEHDHDHETSSSSPPTSPVTEESSNEMYSSTTIPSQPPPPSSGTQDKRATRHQKIHIQHRKYPLGAGAQCFECGFETLDHPVQPSASTSDPHSIPSRDSTNKVVRCDIRLYKPRDYICPQCQTVNFNNRLHCVGCGTLAPWIRDQVVKGPKGGRGRSTKDGSLWLDRLSKK
ncbi:hypothetical protein BGX31_010552 [Mortierella sp. GBA43]|nr:hypothetical protein BGX31_010552 [Mortierella sp. GBA43]